MSDKEDIREISEVTTESGIFGTRHVVVVDGSKKKFKTLQEASDYREAAVQAAAEAEERAAQAAAEAEERAAQAAAEAKERAEYDLDPEYLAVGIRPPIDVKDPKEGFFSDSPGGATIDLGAYISEINNACYRLSRQGYEIVSVTPLISGHAGYKNKTDHSIIQKAGWGWGWGAGWGYSFTEGVVLLARKIKH